MGKRSIESNPSTVSYEDCWNLHTRLDGITAEHLRAFLHLSKTHLYAGTPGIIAEKYRNNMDKSRAHNEWPKILRKMLYAFENQPATHSPRYSDDMDEDGYAALMDEYHIREEDRKRRVEEGMQLFVDYYSNLWM